MSRTNVTVALVVPVLLALFAGAALAGHKPIQCPHPGPPPSCEGTEAYEDMFGTPSDDKMAGAGGNDLMYGLDGKDTVSGGAGEDMLGGNFDGSGWHEQRLLFLFANGKDPGEDEFHGGPGRDVIFARECETESENAPEPKDCIDSGAPAPDIIDCGPGNTDFASFDKKPNVKDVVRNCERLEWKPETIGQNTPCAAQKPWDNADVKCIGGTNGPDKNLVDRDNPDARIVDNMAGFAGDDTLRARRGFDILSGGKGNDTLDGGLGEDRLQGDAGDDTMIAGDGDDIIDAEDANNEPDEISCGGGDDDWVWIHFEYTQNPAQAEKSTDINKSTGQPFTRKDITDDDVPQPENPPNDPGKSPAGCEYVSNGGPSLGDWLNKIGKPKHKKHRKH
jgi:hypothetical protein